MSWHEPKLMVELQQIDYEEKGRVQTPLPVSKHTTHGLKLWLAKRLASLAIQLDPTIIPLEKKVPKGDTLHQY